MTEFNDPNALVEWFDEQLFSLRSTDHPFIDPEDFEKVFDWVLREAKPDCTHYDEHAVFTGNP